MKSQNEKTTCNSTEADAAQANGAFPLDLVRHTASRFQGNGIDAPRLCAEMLLAHALGADRTAVYRLDTKPLSMAAVARFEALVQRRLAREPVQHLIGRTEFHSHTIRCDRRAMIPRPETELCIEAVLECAAEMPQPLIVDIGTGTGCIAIALAHELPEARILATDISAEALALARKNVLEHGLGERIRLIRGDLVEPLKQAGLAQRCDIVVCNPPYIAAEEMGSLQPEVRDHDPHIALAGDRDGLHFHRRLFAEVPYVVRPGGALVIEMGEDQSEAVGALVRKAHWQIKKIIKDAACMDRVCVARRITDGLFQD